MVKFFKSIVSKIIQGWGYKLIKIEQKENDIPNDIAGIIKNKTMVTAPALSNILEMTRYVVGNKIKGDFVECGVWKGGSVALMAYSLKQLNNLRKIHLFDVFDNICEPDSKVDGERAVREVGGLEFAKGRLKPVDGLYESKGGAGNESEVYILLKDQVEYPAEYIYIHKGWFQETLPICHSDIEKIALLRLDGDWYASTKVCLEYLYGKVSIGGVIIIDDFYTYEGCRRAVEEFWDLRNIKPFTTKVSADCLFWIKV